jgi:glutamate transport system substrate-binding protein
MKGQRVMRFNKYLAAASTMALALALTACGGGDEEEFDTIVAKAEETGELTIGIKYDQPGLGLKEGDGFTGFDVEMAKIVAKGLGVEEGDITFKEAVSANRETFLEQGEVDLIFATYSITDDRKEVVSFGGPYFVAGQSLLVAADNNDITGPETLGGKKLCSVTGSTSAQRVKDEFAEDVQLQEFDSYSKCVDALKGGQLDALTTDDIILAGFAAQAPEELKVVGETFSEERYGVGMPKGDTETCEKVNEILTESFEDGSWQEALEQSVGDSGYELPEPPTLDDCA